MIRLTLAFFSSRSPLKPGHSRRALPISNTELPTRTSPKIHLLSSVKPNS